VKCAKKIGFLLAPRLLPFMLSLSVFCILIVFVYFYFSHQKNPKSKKGFRFWTFLKMSDFEYPNKVLENVFCKITSYDNGLKYENIVVKTVTINFWEEKYLKSETFSIIFKIFLFQSFIYL